MGARQTDALVALCKGSVPDTFQDNMHQLIDIQPSLPEKAFF